MYDERFLNRLLSKVEFTGSCWLWLGSKLPTGYGLIIGGKKRLSKNGRRSYPTLRAHRALYEICNGPIPEGLELDHLCRKPSCVNPDHLEAVTHRTNMLRGEGWGSRHASMTHCPQGHPYSGENLYIEPTRRNRHCRECGREAARRYLRRRRERDKVAEMR